MCSRAAELDLVAGETQTMPPVYTKLTDSEFGSMLIRVAMQLQPEIAGCRECKMRSTPDWH